ncbi:MAG: aspartate dehydrogenase domain-containing protein [Candidatus Omnitrophota bacterium]
MIKVGIVGCGTIGSYLAKEILKRYKDSVRLMGFCEVDGNKVAKLNRLLRIKLNVYSLEDLTEKCDLIIEAAVGEIAVQVVESALKFNKDVMIMSVGGLLKEPQLFKKVKKSKIKLYIPSGAIAGLDALKAAGMSKIKSVSLTTKKPLAGLAGADYIKKNKIDLNKIKTEKVIFEGTAFDAVAGFPKNINVAAVLSLAGIGAKKTRICIIASRQIKRNTHTIAIEGDFGKIICCTENVPSKVNPKTSQLAVLSALAALDGIIDNIRIGN